MLLVIMAAIMEDLNICQELCTLNELLIHLNNPTRKVHYFPLRKMRDLEVKSLT